MHIRAELYPRIDRTDAKRLAAELSTSALPPLIRPAAVRPEQAVKQVELPGCTARTLPRWTCSGGVVDGRYVLLDRVGRGGTSTVYRAQDLLAQGEVALKILHPALDDDDLVADRFRLEARTMQGLEHRNVVRVYGSGTFDALHYIAMEYVAGRSLRTLVADEAPLAPARAIAVVTQLLEGVRFLHSQGIIHRDLKPANVILTASDVVKVTDFGIVARTGAPDMTPAGVILGTTQYVAPERLMAQEYTGASDLYAIGVILYELLTGRLPFMAESVTAIAVKHVTERPVSPAQLNSGVPSALNEVVMQALEKSPAARFADASAFIAALERQAGLGSASRGAA